MSGITEPPFQGRGEVPHYRRDSRYHKTVSSTDRAVLWRECQGNAKLDTSASAITAGIPRRDMRYVYGI